MCHKEFQRESNLKVHIASVHKSGLISQEKHSKVNTASSSRQAVKRGSSRHANSGDTNDDHTNNAGNEADAESEMGVCGGGGGFSGSVDVKPKPGQLASRRERSGSRTRGVTRV